jgi:autotransporter-associated beta strand protein
VLDATERVWAGDIGPYWSTQSNGNSNWVGDSIPSPGDLLIFGNSPITTVNNDFAPGSLFALQFDSGSYEVLGQTITLPPGPEAINVTGGNHQLHANVVITDTTQLDVNSGSLTLASGISGSGGLIKSGDGLLVISGPTTYTGSTSIHSGTLDAGTDLQFNSLDLGSRATLAITIGGTDFSSFDQISVTNEAKLDGTLAIELAPGFTPNEGDAFEILSYGSAQGSFSAYSGLSFNGGMLLPIETSEGVILVATSLPTGAVSIRVDSVAMGGALADFF